MEDTIPSLGGKAGLWQMMESTLQIGEALANDEKSSSRDTGAPLYFDSEFAAQMPELMRLSS